MKSSMVMNADYIKDKESYSDLQVMHSGAGYYVGTIYTDEDGFQEPGSRDSCYFPTKEAAQKYLDEIERGNIEASFELRTSP